MPHKREKRSTARKADDLQWNLDRARRRGQMIVEPKPNQLQIDLDGARALRRYGMQYSILKRAGLTKGWREKITPSKKRGHVHVTITFPQSGLSEKYDVRLQPPGSSLLLRIGLQAILGSDPAREAFNWCRAVKGNKYPVVFFEPERRTKRCAPRPAPEKPAGT